MTVYRVENMTCGHCVRTIEKAVHALDATATVDVDLAGCLVRIEGDKADATRLAAAIGNAGYPASLVGADPGAPPVATSAARRGCCCG